MTRDEALAKMQEIDNMRAVLTEAHSRLNLIAAGVIESPEEITLQSTKAQAAIDKYLKRTKNRVPVQLTIPA